MLVLDGHTRVKENYDHERIAAVEARAEEIMRRMAAAGQIQH